MNEYGFSCPTCGSADVRRSRRQGFSEIPKMLLGIYPFRCLGCGDRFFGNVWLLATRGYANCPKCLRLSVLPWAKRESHLSGGDKLRQAFGAHTYRCVPCRYTFLSFRKGIAPSGYPGTAEGELDASPGRHPGVPGNEAG
jgi:DNA-directed RNA polymerase subunit RPC12/RpoP